MVLAASAPPAPITQGAAKLASLTPPPPPATAMAAAPDAAAAPRLQLSFGAVTEKNIEQLKVMNKVLFPINYPDKMYSDILAFPDVTQVGGCAGVERRVPALGSVLACWPSLLLRALAAGPGATAKSTAWQQAS